VENINISFFKKNNYLQFPRVIQFEITNNCPLDCPQCYKDIDNVKDMDFGLFKKMASEAKRIGVKRAMLNGGEPLSHPQFLDFVKYLNSIGILPTCFTSGAGMTAKIAAELKKTNIELCVSFNGSTEEINKRSRDGYKKALSAVGLLNEFDVPFSINWVARDDNVLDFEDLIQFSREMNSKGITVVCSKINGKYLEESPLHKEGYEMIKRLIRKDENEKYINIQNCNNILAVYSYDMPVSKLYGCPAGVMSFAVTVDGEFVPCPHLYMKEEYKSITEYWDASKYLNSLRNNETKNLKYCSECSRSDRCRFCRAICKESHEDFSVGYMGCPIFKC